MRISDAALTGALARALTNTAARSADGERVQVKEGHEQRRIAVRARRVDLCALLEQELGDASRNPLARRSATA
jgi:hypothetical protein